MQPTSTIELFNLSGRVALVTGSSRGLGSAMAQGLAGAGATVVLNGRNTKTLEATASAMRETGGDVHVSAFDVTDEAGVDRSIGEIESHVGPIDVLINNAGNQGRGSLETIDRTTFETILQVHVVGAFLVGRRVAQGMIERRRGKIINTCSLTSEAGRPGVGAYMTAKGALRNLTRAMAVDWAKYNIQVNGIGPGFYPTDMTEVLATDPEFDAWLRKRTPAGRWGTPQDLMGATVFLASDASAFVTGQIVYVDGGILASL